MKMINNFSPSPQAFALALHFEGCKLNAYKDQRGIWTIGIGHTANVYPGQFISTAQAQEFFKQDMQERITQTNAVISSPITQNMFDACLDFVFNEGIGNFMSSTLLKLINSNPLNPAIESQFLAWDKIRVDNKLIFSQGLLNRRKAEWELYSRKIS